MTVDTEQDKIQLRFNYNYKPSIVNKERRYKSKLRQNILQADGLD